MSKKLFATLLALVIACSFATSALASDLDTADVDNISDESAIEFMDDTVDAADSEFAEQAENIEDVTSADDTAVESTTAIIELGYDLTLEHDLINGDNAYLDFKDRFESMGLRINNVKSLQALGLSYDDILELDEARIKELLPNYGAIVALRAAPTTYITVTGCGSGANATVDFHPDTGYVKGTWATNGGATIHTKIDNLAKAAYGSTTGVTRYYHYWGNWTDANGTHQGIDMYKVEGSTIKSAHSGKVVTVGTLGRVGIYNSSKSVTYFYAHMKNRKVALNDTVAVGDPIGEEGKEGVTGSHLHFEVRSGSTTSMGLTDDKKLNTVNPYNHL